jgi:hypothetical protein
MPHPTIHDLRRLWRTRYEELSTWDRVDLERYAIALSHQTTLAGATKIRLLRSILHTEFGGWPQGEGGQ